MLAVVNMMMMMMTTMMMSSAYGYPVHPGGGVYVPEGF